MFLRITLPVQKNRSRFPIDKLSAYSAAKSIMPLNRVDLWRCCCCSFCTPYRTYINYINLESKDNELSVRCSLASAAMPLISLDRGKGWHFIEANINVGQNRHVRAFLEMLRTAGGHLLCKNTFLFIGKMYEGDQKRHANPRRALLELFEFQCGGVCNRRYGWELRCKKISWA